MIPYSAAGSTILKVVGGGILVEISQLSNPSYAGLKGFVRITVNLLSVCVFPLDQTKKQTLDTPLDGI